MTQYDWPVVTGNESFYIKIAKLSDPGSNNCHVTLMVTNAGNYGSTYGNIDFIEISARGLPSSLTADNVSRYLSIRRLGATGLTDDNQMRYGLVKGDGFIEVWALQRAFINGAKVAVLAQTARTELYIPDGFVKQTAAPSGYVEGNVVRIYDQVNKPTKADLGLSNAMLTGAFGLGGSGISTNGKMSDVEILKALRDKGGHFWRGDRPTGSTATIYSHGSGIFSRCGDTWSAINIDYSTAKIKIYAGNDARLNNGNFSVNELYGSANKPSKSDVGLGNVTNDAQVKKTGDTMTGGLTFANDSILAWIRNTDWAKIGFKNDADGDTDSYMWFETGDNGNEYFKWRSRQSTTTKDLMNLKWDALSVLVKALFSSEVKISTVNALRIFNSSFGAIFRRSEESLHIIPTRENEGENGDIGPLRPFNINLRTGVVSVGHGLNVTGGVNGSLNGNASTATKLQTARNINGVKFDGSGDININTLVSRGRVTALSGSTQGTAGIQMYEAYNNSYPTTYGNVLHMKGASATGEGELLIGWSGTSGAHAPVFIRSRRDNTDAAWSGWAQVYTSKDSIPGVNTTGNQNTTGNAASATKLQTARTINGVSFDGSANISLSPANIGCPASPTGWLVTGDNGASITTEQLVTLLRDNGAFNAKAWIARCAWAYANSASIPDSETGCGIIPLAGAVIEVFNNGNSSNNYTIRITTATTTGVSGALTNAEFVYVFNGTTYSPGWRRAYNTKNKPTAADVGALPLSGGALTGGLTAAGEIISKSANGLRIAYGNYGFFIRNDGSSTYFMLTDSGDSLGTYNSLRPLTINNANGAVSIGNGLTVYGSVGLGTANALGGNSIVLGDNDTGFKQNGDGILDVYANSQRVFRFKNDAAFSLKKLLIGDSKTFSLSSSNTSTKNVTFNLWGASTRPVVAELGDDSGWHFYSQRNTDNSVIFSVNGQIQPSNWGNFDSRYVKDVRLGTRVVQTMQKGVMYEKSGHVITGLGIIGAVDGDDPAVFRPIQKYINGTWYNVAQV